jgi:serine/threonine-protein kinase
MSVVRSPKGAPERDEATRARGFAGAAFLLCVLGAAAQPLLGGATWLHAMMIGALAAMGTASAIVWRVARDPHRYTRQVERAFAAVALSASIVTEYYLGVFSPAPIFVTLGIGFFALGSDRVVAVGLPVAAALSYALVASLVAIDVLPDDGVIAAKTVPRELAFAVTGLVAVVQLLAMAQARVTRRATEEAIARSNDAVRERMRREAQLEDANRDLDQLLRMGAGRAGAYTGVMAAKYVLGDLIGRGAMGEVYKATHTTNGQQAAVKLLQPSLAADENVVARFFREGEAASKLVAPNVVSIFEIGRTADGSPFIVMELLRGHDLAWHLRQRGQLTLEEVVGVVEQVAAGLEAARQAGIVHRDLKPQNLFLAQQQRAAPLWKILDFGVSRLLGSSGTLTQDQIVGTPGYMSPEQAAGRDATHRSDVFSFGVVVYRALTGQPAFVGPDTPQILYQVVYRNPPRPSEIVPSLPNDVDLVLAIALAKDQEDRFASALELAAALKSAAKSELEASQRLHARTLLATLPWGASARSEESMPNVGETSSSSS